MAVDQKLFLAEKDSPDRCQGRIPSGQCAYVKTNGDFCPIHQPNWQNRTEEQTKIRNFRLLRYQDRVNEFADSSQVKSLREEIGILRLCLEEIVNKCDSPTELILYSGKISDTIMKIEKLVVSCHRLEFATGSLLDKTTIIQIANVMIDTVCKYVTNENDLESISKVIYDTILNTKIIEQDPPQSRAIPHGATG